ncbi:MAG: hypothetical protein CW345_03330 [Firmicutes bacterium]|nr:hypothetical protein [Bacillota bacterium]
MKPALRLAAGLPLAQVMGLILVSAVALAGWAAVRLEADGPGAAGPTVQSGPEAAAPARRLRLAAFNIRHGRTVQGRVDLDRAVETLSRLAADVVFLSEVDQHWRRSGFIDQVAYLARSLDMPYVHFAPALTTRSLLHTSPGTTARYGNLFLSRLPIAGAGAAYLPRLGRNEPRNVLWIDVQIWGTTVRLYGTHLSVDGRERVLQLNALAELVAASPYPTVILGDFNSPPERLAHDAPFLWEAPWHDAHVAAGEGDGSTFPAPSPQSRIDYAFVHTALLPLLAAAEVVPSDASDHWPVVIEFVAPQGL